jgi:hypothetical protein
VSFETISAAGIRGLTLLVLISGASCTAQPHQHPGTLPCDWTSDSSSEGITHHLHYLGDKPGLVRIKYNMYVKPDDIKVMYRGQLIGGTGGPRSGRGQFSFVWNPVADDYVVDVVVTGEMWGTRWSYAMTCPVAASS